MQKWSEITSDKFVLSLVRGYEIEFETEPICSVYVNKNFSNTEKRKIECELERLLRFGAVEYIEKDDVLFSSPIFLVPKPDNSHRLILNLKNLNKFLRCPHFKLEDFRSVCNLIRKGDFFTKIDLKDAYLSVPVSPKASKYLSFNFEDRFYCYKALPFGLNMSPYLFTKLLRPVVRTLRERGIRIVIYLDDIILFCESKELCTRHTKIVLQVLQSLGFTINWKKSVLEPVYKIEYLGLVFDSLSMQVSLPERKRIKVSELCEAASKKPVNTIQYFSELQGNLIAACSAIPYGLLYTRALAKAIADNLAASNDDYAATMTLSRDILDDLQWWSVHVKVDSQNIRQDHYDRVISTDASLSGYGACSNGHSMNGFWTIVERDHINVMELVAIERALHYYCAEDRDKQILLRVDSRTAIAYINRLGGVHSLKLHEIAKRIWEWAMQRKLWLVASYIPSRENIVADFESRKKISDLDWQLSRDVFLEITKNFGWPTIDLFASVHSRQTERYVSLLPEGDAENTDAFTIDWSEEYGYCFAPFCLIARVLRKAKQEKAKLIIIVPNWPSQVWYPELLSMCVSDILSFGPDRSLLQSAYVDQPHPLHKTLQLLALVISGHSLPG